MAKLVYVERRQVKAGLAKMEKLLAKDPEAKREAAERLRDEKAEKRKRDREYAATQPKPRTRRAKR